MTIKELIEELKKYPEDMEVVMIQDHMEQGAILVSPDLEKGRAFKETRSFMDAFDYQEYTSNVWRIRRKLDAPKITDIPVLVISEGNSKED